MPISIADASNRIKDGAANFGRLYLRNPILAALIVSIVVLIIVIWLFRYDNGIKKRRTKMSKLFIYTFIASLGLIFIQNTYLLRNTKDGGAEVISSGILQGNDMELSVSKLDKEYVNIKPNIDSNIFNIHNM